MFLLVISMALGLHRVRLAPVPLPPKKLHFKKMTTKTKRYVRLGIATTRNSASNFCDYRDDHCKNGVGGARSLLDAYGSVLWLLDFFSLCPKIYWRRDHPCLALWAACV